MFPRVQLEGYVSVRQFMVNLAALCSVNVFRLLAQFFAIPILSRLLSPSEYGIVGMAMPFMLFGMLVADSGVGMSLVRVPSTDTDTWSTCFWLSLLIGLLAGCVMAGLSPLAGYLMGEPGLVPLIAVLAVTVVTQAGGTVPGARLQQSQRFKLVASMEVAMVLISIGVAVFIALRGGGAWALVAQQVTFFCGRFLLVLTFSGFRPTLVFKWDRVREHMVFGRNILGSNLLSFFSKSADNLVIGKVLGSAPVGFYAMGVQFASLPGTIITGPLQYVLYSQLAKIKNNLSAIRGMFLFITRGVALILFPVVGMTAAAHDAVFGLMLSPKWSPSGEIFMLVAPVSVFLAVTSLGGTVMMVIQRPDIQLRISAEFALLWVCSLVASAWFGVWWVAVAYNCAILAYLPRSLSLMLPLMECSVRSYVSVMIAPVVLTILCVGLFLGLRHFTPWGHWAEAGSALAIAVAGIGAGAALQRGVLIKELNEGKFAWL